MEIMAEAIELAEFVVVFVSRAYRDSYNCKLEGKYAQIRERAGLAHIMYVMMEEDYTPLSVRNVRCACVCMHVCARGFACVCVRRRMYVFSFAVFVDCVCVHV